MQLKYESIEILWVKIFEGGFRSRRPGAAQGWMR